MVQDMDYESFETSSTNLNARAKNNSSPSSLFAEGMGTSVR